MPAGSTYTPIATTTLGSSSSSVTFSSISGSYTDLVCVISSKLTSGGVAAPLMRFNSDSGTNYSQTLLQGNGSAAASGRESNATGIEILSSGSEWTNCIVHLQNYSNTTTNKTILERANAAGALVRAYVGMWRNTGAINSVNFSGATFDTGSTFTLYGIASA